MSSIVPAPIARQPWQMLFPLFVLIAFGALVLFSAAGGSWDPYASSHVIRFSVFLVMAFVLSRFSRELVLFFAFPIFSGSAPSAFSTLMMSKCSTVSTTTAPAA